MTQTNDRNQCGNAPFGCGRGIDWMAWVREIHLCTACAARAARHLGVAVKDLGLALTAYQAASQGHGEAEPTVQEVWAILDTLPAPFRPERQVWIPPMNPHAPADSSLPEGDRVAA